MCILPPGGGGRGGAYMIYNEYCVCVHVDTSMKGSRHTTCYTHC